LYLTQLRTAISPTTFTKSGILVFTNDLGLK
jgi:hypothetical protein